MSFSLKRRTCWCRNWQLRGIQSESGIFRSRSAAARMNLFRFFSPTARVTMQLYPGAAGKPTFAARALVYNSHGRGKEDISFPSRWNAAQRRETESARIIAPAARLPIHSPAIIFHNALAICIFIYSTCAGRSSARIARGESNVFSHFAAHGAEKWPVFVPWFTTMCQINCCTLQIFTLTVFLRNFFLVMFLF